MFLLLVLLSLVVCVTSFSLRAPIRKNIRLHLSDSTDEPATPKSAPATPKATSKEVTLAPINDDSIKAAGAISGGVIGFLLAGPLGGVLLAAISNYVAKKNDETGEAIRGFGKTSLEVYNYLTKLNSKYEVSDKLGSQVGSKIEALEAENESVGNIRSAISTTTTKISELDKEYDFVGKGKQVATAAGALSDSAIDKLLELNNKYDFVGSSVDAAKKAVEKAKSSSD